MRSIILITLILLLASAVPAQKKSKTYEEHYAAYYAKHCVALEPRIKECTNNPSTQGCKKIMARKLNCDTAKLLSEPVHHPTAEEWMQVYEMLGPNWELYDALERLHWSQFDCPRIYVRPYQRW